MYKRQAIRLFEKLGNVKEQANTKGNLGIVYYRTGNKQKAIELFKESAMLRESVSDIKGLAAIYGNLATAYTSYSLDSAIFFQLQALKNATKTGALVNMAQAHANASTPVSYTHLKTGTCHQCSELNGIFNPKQDFEVEKNKIELARAAGQADKDHLFELRLQIIKEIDPFNSNGSDLQLHHLEDNRKIMEIFLENNEV